MQFQPQQAGSCEGDWRDVYLETRDFEKANLRQSEQLSEARVRFEAGEIDLSQLTREHHAILFPRLGQVLNRQQAGSTLGRTRQAPTTL